MEEQVDKSIFILGQCKNTKKQRKSMEKKFTSS